MVDEKTGWHSAYTGRLIRELSMNSRASISDLSAALGVSRPNVQRRLAAAEKHFNLRYLLELDPRAIGLTEPHLIVMKFRRRPAYGRIIELLSRSHVTQLVALTSGQYDMIVYANAFSKEEYYAWNATMRNKLILPYRTRWEESEISYQRLGFLPVRNEAIARSPLKEKDRKILLLLNSNSRMPLDAISRATGIGYKSVSYHIKRLVARGYIKRFTVSAGMSEGVVPMTLLSRFIPSDDAKGTALVTVNLFTHDDAEGMLNRYQATAALAGSYGFFVLGSFRNRHRAYVDMVIAFRNAFRRFGKSKAVHAVITSVPVGSLPLRNVDAKAVYRYTL